MELEYAVMGSTPKGLSFANSLASSRPDARIVHDGTCPSGYEVVAGPFVGVEVLRYINSIAYLNNITESTFDYTCGLHIHVDMHRENVLALRNLTLLWWQLEEEIIRQFVPLKRRNSNGFTRYAWPFRTVYSPADADVLASIDSNDRRAVERALYEWVYGYPALTNADLPPKPAIRGVGFNQNDKRAQNNPWASAANGPGNARYSALNLASWWWRGTVEFRLFQACGDYANLLRRALLCGWLCEIACRLTLSQITQLSSLHRFAASIPHKPTRKLLTEGWVSPVFLKGLQ
jgi:hypothetical protein